MGVDGEMCVHIYILWEHSTYCMRHWFEDENDAIKDTNCGKWWKLNDFIENGKFIMKIGLISNLKKIIFKTIMHLVKCD